jgi:hypothetical protein
MAIYLDEKGTKPIYGRLETAAARSSYGLTEIDMEDPVLKKWMDAHEAYLLSNVRRRAVVKAYTYYGDVLANTFLRKKTIDEPLEILTSIRKENKTIPFAYQIYDHYDFLVKQGLEMPERSTLMVGDVVQKEAMFKLFEDNFIFFLRTYILNKLIKDYCAELYRIILKAPKICRDITVYRGIKNEQNLEPGILRFKGDSFVSTSLNLDSAMEFTEGYSKTRCCLYKILIRKKTPCLYIHDVSRLASEFEILLPYNVVFVHSPALLQATHHGDSVLVRAISTDGIVDGYVRPTYTKLGGAKTRKNKRRTRKRTI